MDSLPLSKDAESVSLSSKRYQVKYDAHWRQFKFHLIRAALPKRQAAAGSECV